MGKKNKKNPKSKQVNSKEPAAVAEEHKEGT